MKIYYERDPGTGKFLLQWGMSESIGRDFSAFLTENGRHVVFSPPFGRYGKKGWLGIAEAELMAMEEKGKDNTRDDRSLECEEVQAGKRTGKSFTASFGSLIKEVGTPAFVVDQDPLIASKQAGDFLNEKARTTAAAESISYAAAFSRACHDNPEAYQCYRG